MWNFNCPLVFSDDAVFERETRSISGSGSNCAKWLFEICGKICYTPGGSLRCFVERIKYLTEQVFRFSGKDWRKQIMTNAEKQRVCKFAGSENGYYNCKDILHRCTKENYKRFYRKNDHFCVIVKTEGGSLKQAADWRKNIKTWK